MRAGLDRAVQVSSCAASIAPTMIRALRELAGEQSIDFGLGQPDLPISEAVRTRLIAELTGPVHAPYSSNAGFVETRQAVADHEGCGADQVLITCGVQQGLAVALLGLIEAGDEVLIPNPGFPAYANLVRAAGGVPVPYDLRPGDGELGWQLDPSAVERALTPKTQLLVLNSPSNPTGGIHDRESLEAVLELTGSRGIRWVSDEIYEDYLYDAALHCSPRDFDGHRDRGIKLGGLSKSHHMMGWRLGWMIGPTTLMKALTPLHQHLVTCAPTLIQHAAIAALADHEATMARTMAVFDRRRKIAVEGCRELDGVRFANPVGAFYLFADVRARLGKGQGSFELACDILDKVDVVTIPGSGFGPGGEGFLRMAYTIDETKLAEGFERLRHYFDRYGH
jgi:aminotransferase